jgi:hypothetical protein
VVKRSETPGTLPRSDRALARALDWAQLLGDSRSGVPSGTRDLLLIVPVVTLRSTTG